MLALGSLREYKELWLLRNIKPSLRMALKLLGRIPAGAFHAFRASRVELRARKYELRDRDRAPPFAGTLFRGRDFSRRSLITHRTTPPPLPTFDPAEMYISLGEISGASTAV